MPRTPLFVNAVAFWRSANRLTACHDPLKSHQIPSNSWHLMARPEAQSRRGTAVSPRPWGHPLWGWLNAYEELIFCIVVHCGNPSQSTSIEGKGQKLTWMLLNVSWPQLPMALLVGSFVFFLQVASSSFKMCSEAQPFQTRALFWSTLRLVSSVWRLQVPHGQEFEKDQGPLNTPEKLMTYPPWLIMLIGPFGCVSVCRIKAIYSSGSCNELLTFGALL